MPPKKRYPQKRRGKVVKVTKPVVTPQAAPVAAPVAAPQMPLSGPTMVRGYLAGRWRKQDGTVYAAVTKNKENAHHS